MTIRPAWISTIFLILILTSLAHSPIYLPHFKPGEPETQYRSSSGYLKRANKTQRTWLVLLRMLSSSQTFHTRSVYPAILL